MPGSQTEFVAVLVFDYGDGRRGIEPHVVTGSHPEVAYQRALAKGAEVRFARRFVGLAELMVKTEDVPPVGKLERGAAAELVVPKERLAAFQETRRLGVPHDQAEVAAALAEPPALVDLPGLDQVDWGHLSHAYGAAGDVPVDLRRLASSDAAVRAEALWQLGGSIYHQGDVFDATAAAVPFLVRLASERSLPNRCEILELLAAIAASGAAIKPEAVRKAWAERQEQYPMLTYARPPAEMAEAQIAAGLAVRAAMERAGDALRALSSGPDAAVGRAAEAALQATDGRRRGPQTAE